MEQAPGKDGTYTRDEIEELLRRNNQNNQNEIEELKRLIAADADSDSASRRSQTGDMRNKPVSDSQRGSLMDDGLHEFTRLSEDTFSFLIAAKIASFPFFTAVVVVTIKMAMYSLIFADLMTKGSPGNPLGIPASIVIPVAISQIFAVASKYVHADSLRNSPYFF